MRSPGLILLLGSAALAAGQLHYTAHHRVCCLDNGKRRGPEAIVLEKRFDPLTSFVISLNSLNYSRSDGCIEYAGLRRGNLRILEELEEWPDNNDLHREQDHDIVFSSRPERNIDPGTAMNCLEVRISSQAEEHIKRRLTRIPFFTHSDLKSMFPPKLDEKDTTMMLLAGTVIRPDEEETVYFKITDSQVINGVELYPGSVQFLSAIDRARIVTAEFVMGFAKYKASSEEEEGGEEPDLPQRVLDTLRFLQYGTSRPIVSLKEADAFFFANQLSDPTLREDIAELNIKAVLGQLNEDFSYISGKKMLAVNFGQTEKPPTTGTLSKFAKRLSFGSDKKRPPPRYRWSLTETGMSRELLSRSPSKRPRSSVSRSASTGSRSSASGSTGSRSSVSRSQSTGSRSYVSRRPSTRPPSMSRSQSKSSHLSLPRPPSMSRSQSKSSHLSLPRPPSMSRSPSSMSRSPSSMSRSRMSASSASLLPAESVMSLSMPLATSLASSLATIAESPDGRKPPPVARKKPSGFEQREAFLEALIRTYGSKTEEKIREWTEDENFKTFLEDVQETCRKDQKEHLQKWGWTSPYQVQMRAETMARWEIVDHEILYQNSRQAPSSAVMLPNQIAEFVLVTGWLTASNSNYLEKMASVIFRVAREVPGGHFRVCAPFIETQPHVPREELWKRFLVTTRGGPVADVHFGTLDHFIDPPTQCMYLILLDIDKDLFEFVPIPPRRMTVLTLLMHYPTDAIGNARLPIAITADAIPGQTGEDIRLLARVGEEEGTIHSLKSLLEKIKKKLLRAKHPGDFPPLRPHVAEVNAEADSRHLTGQYLPKLQGGVSKRQLDEEAAENRLSIRGSRASMMSMASNRNSVASMISMASNRNSVASMMSMTSNRNSVASRHSRASITSKPDSRASITSKPDSRASITSNPDSRAGMSKELVGLLRPKNKVAEGSPGI